MHRLLLFAALLPFFAAHADEELLRLPFLSPPSTDAAATSNRFAVEATVVLPIGKAPKWVCFEIGNRNYLIENMAKNCRTPLNRGDVVEISGHLWRTPMISRLCATYFRLSPKGHRPLPAPPLVSATEFQQKSILKRHVRLRGTLKDCFSDSVDDICVFLPLSTADGEVCIVILKDDGVLESLDSLIGRTVEVSGICSAEYAGVRKYLQHVLVVQGPESLSVLPDAPLRHPQMLDLHSLTNATPQEIAAAGLCKAAGRVMATWDADKLLLKTDLGSLITVTLAASSLPEAGEWIEVAGHPETDLFYLKLARARWKKAEAMPYADDPPADILFKDILTNKKGSSIINANYHGKVARMRACVRGIPTDGNGNPRLLLEQDGLVMLLDCSGCKNVAAAVPVGSLVDVTGICILDSESWAPNNGLPKVNGMLLVPRSARDIHVVAHPSWWTPVRLWKALGILVAVLVAVFVWNRILQFRVERRSRALVKAERASLKSTLRIDERTRLAAELHDSVAQSLTVISYQLSAAETALDIGDADTKKYLATAAGTLQSCRTELRRCIWDLRSNALDEKDFEKALVMTSSPVAGSSRLQIRFKVARSLISDSCAHTVLSIVRELVSNAARHGKATSIRVAGDFREGWLRFSVLDDGTGFETGSRPGQKDGHFGLDGVVERIKRSGGTIEIDSAPGKGTHIVVGLPPATKDFTGDLT